MKQNKLDRNKWFSSDSKFNQLYPLSIQSLALRHWTPLNVAKRAARFLTAGTQSKILDVGCGVGKFCLVAGHYHPKHIFVGIEQRKALIVHAEAAKQRLYLQNALFMTGNFTQLNFRDYDHFYYYNSFYENLIGTDRIDQSISYSDELYNYYTRYLFNRLVEKPSGTRLATFHSLEDEIPPDYKLAGSEMDNLLRLWIKL